jgi:acyl-CoA thioesterase I
VPTLALLTALTFAMIPRPPPSHSAPHPSRTYVALGDSTGVGVGARHGGGYPARLVGRLAGEGTTLQLVNRCVSGARVVDVLAEQLPGALGARPDLLTLGVGINDVTHGTDLARFADDYERVAAALAGTGAPVVVVNVPDLALSPLAQGEETQRLVRRRIALVNGVIAAAVRRHGFTLVDLYASTEEELARDPEGLFSEDRFHPSDAGYERWAELMAPALRRALAGPAGRGAGLPSGPALR